MLANKIRKYIEEFSPNIQQALKLVKLAYLKVFERKIEMNKLGSLFLKQINKIFIPKQENLKQR